MASVIFGTLTVAVVYGIGKWYRNRTVGLFAAFFLAISFLHTRDSHFATTDIAMVFFVAWSLFFLLMYLETGKVKHYFQAVFIAGVATAVKYNAVLICFPIALGYFLTRFRHAPPGGVWMIVKTLIWDGCAAFALLFLGFFICSPFVILDFNSARPFFEHLRQVNQSFSIHWLFHMKMLYHGLGPVLFVMACFGMSVSVWRPNRKELVFLCFPVLYYLIIAKAGQPFARYVLPLVPFGIVWAAAFFSQLSTRYVTKVEQKGRHLAIGLLVVTLLTLPKTIYSDYLFLKSDTRDLAEEWLRENVSSSKTLILDDTGKAPKLTPTKDQVRKKISTLEKTGPLASTKVLRLENLLALESYPTPNYNLYYLQESSGQNQFTLLGPFVDYDRNEVLKIAPDYLLTNELAKRHSSHFYNDVLKDFELIVTFDSRRNAELELKYEGWTYLPIDDDLWNYKRPGPPIYIYRFKGKRV